MLEVHDRKSNIVNVWRKSPERTGEQVSIILGNTRFHEQILAEIRKAASGESQNQMQSILL